METGAAAPLSRTRLRASSDSGTLCHRAGSCVTTAPKPKRVTHI